MDQVFLVLGGGKHGHQSELLKIKNTKVISVQPSSPEGKIHVIEKKLLFTCNTKSPKESSTGASNK